MAKGEPAAEETTNPTGAVERSLSMPLGVVVARRPGVTRWARWRWDAPAVLPGAGPADGRALPAPEGAEARHLATLPLTLFRGETEAYRVALANEPPLVWAVLRFAEDAATDAWPEVHAVTASAFEAQDFDDAGDDIVVAVPAPPALVAWIAAFIERHHVDEPFIKRRRDRAKTDGADDGIGDPRVRQAADVYRAPSALKPRRPSAEPDGDVADDGEG